MKTTQILALAGLLAAVPATAVVTPISGSVAAKVQARIGTGPDQSGPDASESWTTLQPGTAFNASSSKTVSFVGGLVDNSATAMAYRSVNATWASATAGHVRVDWGWAFTGPVMQKAAAPQSEFTPNWRYAFTLTTPTELNLNAVRQSSAVNGNFEALNSFFLFLSDGGPGFILDQNLTLPTSSFSKTMLLGPGSYELQLKGNTGVSGLISQWSADGDFDLDWSLNPMTAGVPEPTSWAMLIAGFGLTGVSMRRRQAQLRRVTA